MWAQSASTMSRSKVYGALSFIAVLHDGSGFLGPALQAGGDRSPATSGPAGLRTRGGVKRASCSNLGVALSRPKTSLVRTERGVLRLKVYPLCLLGTFPLKVVLPATYRTCARFLFWRFFCSCAEPGALICHHLPPYTRTPLNAWSAPFSESLSVDQT